MHSYANTAGVSPQLPYTKSGLLRQGNSTRLAWIKTFGHSHFNALYRHLATAVFKQKQPA